MTYVPLYECNWSRLIVTLRNAIGRHKVEYTDSLLFSLSAVVRLERARRLVQKQT